MALLIGFYLLENYRGSRAWKLAKARLVAKGEKVDWASFAHRLQVPDDKNVLKHPFMQEYAVWVFNDQRRTEVDSKVRGWFQPGFLGHRLHVAGPNIPLTTLRNLPHEAEEAQKLADLDPMLDRGRTSEKITFRNAPLTNALETLAQQIGIEVVFASDEAPFVKSPLPGGGGRRELLIVNFEATNTAPARALDQLLERHQLRPVRRATHSYAIEPRYVSLAELAPRRSRFSVAVGRANFIGSLQSVARNQTMVNQAYLACALERYRMANGNYPDNLDALVPEFAATLPRDLFDGRPLRYRRLSTGKYLLYSIGWNSTDELGEMPPHKDGEPSWRKDKGDWIWQS